jgi:hypothetical protein
MLLPTVGRSTLKKLAFRGRLQMHFAMQLLLNSTLLSSNVVANRRPLNFKKTLFEATRGDLDHVYCCSIAAQ